MPTFYTRAGDDGYTGLLGEGRVPKYDLRLESIGAIDEANASIGMARILCNSAANVELLIQVQRDLYGLMTAAAATAKNVEKFQGIDPSRVRWLEEQTEVIGRQVEIPREFILPGDTAVGAALDLARTIVRRAERRMAELLHRGDVSNPELLRYLNRLSSLLFVLELHENRAAGQSKPTLAKSR